MDKIIVEVKCPASAKSYEFRISKRLPVSEGMGKIISEIQGFEQNERIFSMDNGLSLFCARLGSILNTEMSFEENGVKGGDMLMII